MAIQFSMGNILEMAWSVLQAKNDSILLLIRQLLFNILYISSKRGLDY